MGCFDPIVVRKKNVSLLCEDLFPFHWECLNSWLEKLPPSFLETRRPVSAGPPRLVAFEVNSSHKVV